MDIKMRFKDFDKHVKTYWRLGNDRYLIELFDGNFGFYKLKTELNNSLSLVRESKLLCK